MMGFLLKKKKEGNYYLYEQNEKNTLETETGVLSSFYIWMQNKKQIYERSYKKVQNVMGDIGGSIKIIITLASWINYLSYKHTVFLDINKVINLYCYFNDQNLSNNKNHFISLNIKNSAIYKNNNIMNIMENSNRSSDKSNKININKNYNKININNNNNNNINNNNNNSNNISENKRLNNLCFQKYNQNNSILIDLLNLKEENKINFKDVKNNNKNNKIIEYNKMNLFKFLKWYVNTKLNKNNNYLLYISNYYKKIISEEELFYLYFDVKKIKSIIQKVKSKRISLNNLGNNLILKTQESSNNINNKSLFVYNSKFK